MDAERLKNILELAGCNRIGHGNLRSPSPAGAGKQAAERMDQR